MRSFRLIVFEAVCLLALSLFANCQQVEVVIVPVEDASGQTGNPANTGDVHYTQSNYPYYLQSASYAGQVSLEQLQPEAGLTMDQRAQNLQQRSAVKGPQKGFKSDEARIISGARKITEQVLGAQGLNNTTPTSPQAQIQPPLNSKPKEQINNNCLYQKRYFERLDECLSRKPYPTIGLPAFKNEDLLVKRGINDKYGCVFILNNGLFKSYQIHKFQVDSDSQCLDNTKVGLTMGFGNVSLAYLWSLRCLNKADQLLDDSTFDAATTANTNNEASDNPSARGSICVGSSQNFGFANLQLSGLEAQVELASDIYKNWRVTNITIAMSSPHLTSSARQANLVQGVGTASGSEEDVPIVLGTNIRDYVFESLDGDELNWRYLHLFQNWSRNRMHVNFLEQYRRFLWISMQRCLSEASEKLPIKLNDIFAAQRFA